MAYTLRTTHLKEIGTGSKRSQHIRDHVIAEQTIYRLDRNSLRYCHPYRLAVPQPVAGINFRITPIVLFSSSFLLEHRTVYNITDRQLAYLQGSFGQSR